MNPPCAKCNKTVYPVEKLNCLDKIWHKGCFRCTECNLKLTMATYKGYSKMPYCNTHYPTTRFTQVADAVQSQSAKRSQNLASAVDYKSQYQSSLGQYTQTSDTVSTRHATSAQKQTSGSGYRNESSQGQSYRPPRRDPEPPPTQYYREPEPEPQPQPQRAPARPPASGPRYIAIYDYTATDDDEVSFNDGDIIMNAEVIDEGWMTGTVERTGETGMLPSNYVEKM